MQLTCDTEVFSFFSSLPPFRPAMLLALAKSAVPALASCVVQMSATARVCFAHHIVPTLDSVTSSPTIVLHRLTCIPFAHPQSTAAEDPALRRQAEEYYIYSS